MMITWPCIFKLVGDDELLFIESKQALEAECHDFIWGLDDRLIDSKGLSFIVAPNSDGSIELEAQKKCYDAEEVSVLIQAHEFAKATVCVTKIHFPTVAQAIAALQFSQ